MLEERVPESLAILNQNCNPFSFFGVCSLFHRGEVKYRKAEIFIYSFNPLPIICWFSLHVHSLGKHCAMPSFSVLLLKAHRGSQDCTNAQKRVPLQVNAF